MSVKATTAVWEQSRATGTARLLLLAIADHADPGGLAWPGIARLGKMCRLKTRNGVQKNLQKLKKLGELKIHENASNRRTNLYQITLDFSEYGERARPHPTGGGEPQDAPPVKHRMRGGEPQDAQPPNHRMPEPLRTTKNREGEPARAKREAPAPSDLDFCLEKLQELFPKAIWPLPRIEERLVIEWGPAMAKLEPKDFEALLVWFREASDEARGSERNPKPVWPRDRGEFLRNFPEVIEKVRAWWSEKGARWWEKRQRFLQRQEERERAEAANEEQEGEKMTEEETKVFFSEGF